MYRVRLLSLIYTETNYLWVVYENFLLMIGFGTH
jgi:hypothetical protein